MKHISYFSRSLTGLLFLASVSASVALGCDSEDKDVDEDNMESPTPTDTPALENPESDWASIDVDGEALNFYEHILPIFEEKCLHCHQEDGIAPVSLTTYEDADKWAASIASKVGNLLMPPYLLRRGGDAGVFDESATLSDEQIATVVAWAKSSRQAGEPRDAEIPTIPALADGTDLVLPEFTPEITGGDYAKYDEYRCFRVDVDPGDAPFISGYDVLPGNAKLVHHVVGFIVDKEEYGDAMDELDAESPDREGWPCFGAAGDGVNPTSVPVTWAPGQGVVELPAKSGVKLGETETIVFQVHYNMADPEVIGQSDQTTIRMRFSKQEDLERQATFLLPDPFLDSVFEGTPEELAPGEQSVKYTWSMTGKQLFDPISLLGQIEVVALGPHMHEFGTKMTVSLAEPNGGEEVIIAHTDRWDFNWQMIYSYLEYPVIKEDTVLKVTCEFDTRGADEPVQAGWGTRNEMCLPMLVATLPRGLFL